MNRNTAVKMEKGRFVAAASSRERMGEMNKNPVNRILSAFYVRLKYINDLQIDG